MTAFILPESRRPASNSPLDVEESIDENTFRELHRLLDGDMAELLETYLVEAPRLLKDALRAAGEGECATVQNCAHSLKSSSANLGARRLANLAQSLEDSAASNSNQCADLDGSVKALIAEFANVERILRTRL